MTWVEIAEKLFSYSPLLFAIFVFGLGFYRLANKYGEKIIGHWVAHDERKFKLQEHLVSAIEKTRDEIRNEVKETRHAVKNLHQACVGHFGDIDGTLKVLKDRVGVDSSDIPKKESRP